MANQNSGATKMRSYVKIFFLSLVIIGLTTACKKVGDIEPDNVKNVRIDLNPTSQAGPIGNPTRFEITSPTGQGCKQGSGNNLGCFRYLESQSGDIVFAINGNAPARTCAQHAVRVISKIQISATDADPGTLPSDKGDFTVSPANYPLPGIFQTHGFPAINLNNGVVWEATSTNPATSRVEIENLNSSANTNPQGVIFWYQVSIEKCSDDPNRYWISDPRGENEGMN